MSIWKDRAVPEMKRMTVLCLILGLGFFAASSRSVDDVNSRQTERDDP